MKSVSTVDTIFLCFSIISSILYIYLLVVLVRKRKESPFNSHFFRLFISLGIADLCSGANAYMELTKRWGWVRWLSLYQHEYLGEVFKRFSSAGYVIFGSSQYFGVLALALNRFYNVETTLWTERKQSLALLFQWCVPILGSIPVLSQEFYIYTSNASGVTYTYATMDSRFNLIHSMSLSLSQLVVVIIVAVVYCRIYSHIHKTRRDFGLTEDRKSELKLAMVGFILFVLMLGQQLILLCMVAMSVLNRRALMGLAIKLLYESTTMFAFVNPWILLCCSPPTRRAMFGCCICSYTVALEAHPHGEIEMKAGSQGQHLKARPAIPGRGEVISHA